MQHALIFKKESFFNQVGCLNLAVVFLIELLIPSITVNFSSSNSFLLNVLSNNNNL